MKQLNLSLYTILTIIPSFLTLTPISSPAKNCSDDTTCAVLDTCPGWKEKYTEYKRIIKTNAADPELVKQLKSAVCNKKEKGVCCPNDKEIDKPTYLPDSDSDCGLSSSPPTNIFGGTETTPGEFPFLALLGVKSRWTCAGTLINKWYVVTAGHCGGITRVRLGAWKVDGFKDFNRAGLPPVQDFEVGPEDFTPHPLYRRTLDNVQNDIALIRLPRIAQLNMGVQMACLPLSERKVANELGLRNLGSSLIDKKATIVGWGYNCYEDGLEFCKESAIPAIPSAIPYISQNSLQIPLLRSNKCASKLSTNQICAGGEVGKDICKGDSGGGLFYEEKDVSPWYLLGIVSFGSRICADGKPSVYTRVSSYVPWIRSTLYE